MRVFRGQALLHCEPLRRTVPFLLVLVRSASFPTFLGGVRRLFYAGAKLSATRAQTKSAPVTVAVIRL